MNTPKKSKAKTNNTAVQTRDALQEWQSKKTRPKDKIETAKVEKARADKAKAEKDKQIQARKKKEAQKSVTQKKKSGAEGLTTKDIVSALFNAGKTVGNQKGDDGDTYFENFFEYLDPTGISSWDDVKRAYNETGVSLETGIEAAGAIPLFGKVGKGFKYVKGLSKTADTSRVVKKNVRETHKAGKKIDAVIDTQDFELGGTVPDHMGEYLRMRQLKASKQPNIIQDPNTAIAENQMSLARAEMAAQSDPWAQAFGILGNASMAVGSSLMTQGAGMGQGVSKGGFDWGSLLNQGLGMAGSASQSFEVGGTAGGVPINAEGGEIIETPGGEMGELEGASHAQGGINMQVPPGTDIYSDKVKGPDGKTMAERKKIRERQIAALEKLASENPTDKAIKKTLEKSVKNFELQDQQDVQYMQQLQMAEQLQGMMESMQGAQDMSGMGEAPEEFASGGTVPPFDFSKLFQSLSMPNMSNSSEDWHEGGTGVDWLSAIQNIGSKKPVVVNSQNPITTSKGQIVSNQETSAELAKKLGGGETDTASRGGASPGFTLGDIIGIGGQIYGAFAPGKNTQRSRATDTPNVNSFKDYGKDGLAKLEESKKYINQTRDQNLKSIELGRSGQTIQNRNTARGINTQRALDLAAQSGANHADNQVYTQFLQAMQSLTQQQAGLENDQDAKVMQGEQLRDENDRRDKDAYYTQMARDIANKATGLQKLGKTANQMKTRKVAGDLLNQVYDQFSIDSMSGEIISKATKSIQENPTFYEAHVNNLNTDVRDKIVSGEYTIKGLEVFNKEGKEVDPKTGELIVEID